MSGKQNKILKKLVCAGIVTLVLAGCARANLVDSNSVVEDGIEYYLQTDKSVYNLGENVEMLYRVTNVSENPVDIGMVLRGDGWCDFFVTDDDNTDIWQWMRVMPPADWEMLHLDPDEFRERQTIWDMISDNGTFFDPYDDYPVGPGSYNITGELVLDGGYERVPVSVSIEIIPEPAMIYYVDADANGANDGSSWADAYNYLQDALADAHLVEIHVAQGVYTPDSNSAEPNGTGDRKATFHLINGVTIKGGYAGFGELDPDARDIDAYETTLSGDLAGDDVEVADPRDLLEHPSRDENSYHVVTGSGTDETAVLDGFTITCGSAEYRSRLERFNADNAILIPPPIYGPENWGGGLYNSRGSPTVSSCTFTKNTAYSGGAIYNRYNSSPMLTQCTFSENIAKYGGGMYNSQDNLILTNCTFNGNVATGSGGGIFSFGPILTLTDCLLTENSASWSGGAICNGYGNLKMTNCTLRGNCANYNGGGMLSDHSSVTLTNCTFSGNCSADAGGGMYNYRSDLTLTNCIFSGNSGEGNGGGMYCRNKSYAWVSNCTFAGNSAPNGNAVACESYGQEDPSNIQATNWILWDGGDEIWNNDGSTITITYSDVQGGQTEVYDPCEGLVWGDGNIDADPCFISSGYWDVNSIWVYGDYHLLPDSRCIDAGDPNYVAEPNETDLDGKPRVMGGRIDMGAYEYSPPVLAEVRIVPRTINLASKGKWIGCYIWLPEDYDVADIDPNSVVLEDEIQPESLGVDEEKQVAIVRFSRSEVQDILEQGEVELTVSGELTDGTRFEGTDTIRVIDKGGGGKIKD